MRRTTAIKDHFRHQGYLMFRSGWVIVAMGTLLWATETILFVRDFHVGGDRRAIVAPNSVGLEHHVSLPLHHQPIENHRRHHHHQQQPPTLSATKPKMALVSSFVSANASALIDTRYLREHLVNKACYADLWGYDYILNITWGYPRDKIGKQYWLEYGHWHRVPALQAAMDAGYEWILYTDLDYVIQDLRAPLESFLKEWEFAGKSNVHVLVPNDGDNKFTFSSFAILLRNSDFGRRVVQNWDKAAQGLCPNGNFERMDRYHWELSDQPGLWYALTKTHAEFAGSNWDVMCNTTTGLIQTTTTLYQEMNDYFTAAGAVSGSHGADLDAVPADQPIIFSRYNAHHRSGLGVQKNWNFAKWKKQQFPQAFGMHTKHNLPREMESDLNYCASQRGCFARYNRNGRLEMGCTGTRDMVY